MHRQLNKQFDSQVADMKNSVKDRMNAQSSCAGHFIEQHVRRSSLAKTNAHFP
jgi:probable aminopeptidase NPEPL1